jgi:hypothetical protein
MQLSTLNFRTRTTGLIFLLASGSSAESLDTAAKDSAHYLHDAQEPVRE